MPDFICTLVAAPPAIPCSALNAFVTTLTVSMAAEGGTYATFAGKYGYASCAPSMRVLLPWFESPFTFVLIARCGLPASELVSAVSPAPGMVRSTD